MFFSHSFDLIDLTRQFLINLSPMFYDEAIAGYRYNQSAYLKQNTLLFLDLMDDLDRILATDQRFMLGPWIHDAKVFL